MSSSVRPSKRYRVCEGGREGGERVRGSEKREREGGGRERDYQNA